MGAGPENSFYPKLIENKVLALDSLDALNHFTYLDSMNSKVDVVLTVLSDISKKSPFAVSGEYSLLLQELKGHASKTHYEITTYRLGDGAFDSESITVVVHGSLHNGRGPEIKGKALPADFVGKYRKVDVFGVPVSLPQLKLFCE